MNLLQLKGHVVLHGYRYFASSSFSHIRLSSPIYNSISSPNEEAKNSVLDAFPLSLFDLYGTRYTILIMSEQECNIDKIIKVLSQLQSDLKANTSSLPEKATVSANNEQRSETIGAKKTSWWGKFRESFKKLGKVKNEASNQASDSGGSQGGSKRSRQYIDEDQEDAELEIKRLQNDILQMITAFRNLTEFQTNMSKSLERDLRSTKLRAILKKTDSIRSRAHDLKEIRRKVSALKCQIPSLLNTQSTREINITDSQTAEENDEINENGNDIYLPGLHVSEHFRESSAFEEVLEKFQGLDFTHKLCLLSFAVFPENGEVRRTMLMYWWIGEGFIDCDDSENSVTRVLDEFSAKRLLEPVEDERKLKPSSYKMEPHVHSAVIYLAEELDLFELYSSKGKLIMKKSPKAKVCLVKGSSLQREAKVSVMKPETLQTVFNSSERYPDFTFKWFQSMDSLRVLYLGRWERTAKRHIEVESTKFLENMKSLKNLRLASFQGISRIEKLENYICLLPKLVILDLKACYNLEGLPEDIGVLQNLIYLDVSECYMLDSMPKGIADIRRLQVLKGFVISQSDDEGNCAVKHLVNLRKLSITVNKYGFEVENLMGSLRGLKQLQSLKIAWGACFPGEKSEETNEAEEYREITKEEMEKNQGGPATETKREDDQVQKKEQKSEKTKGEDRVSSKKEEAKLENGKKHEEVKAESSKSDKVVEEEKKTVTSQEATETIKNKPDDQTGKNKVEEEGDGDKGKAGLEERKKQDDVEAEKSKSEGEKKTSPPQETKDTIQNKTDDKTKVENEGDRDEEKADPEEGKKPDKVEAGISKSDKVVEGEKKTSPPQESKDTIENKTDDKTKVENGGDGNKGKVDPEPEKKHDEVEAGISKSDNGVEGVKKASPSGESTDALQKKPDNHQRGNKQEEEGDGEKEKVNLEEGKKHNEIKAESSKQDDKVTEGDAKASSPQESKETTETKRDDHKEDSKVQEKGNGEKEKVNLEEGKKHDEIKAESSKQDDKVTKGDTKTSSPQESKGDGEKGKADLDEGKKKNEVKTESSKPGKVIEGDEKKNPQKESKETTQSKPDDHREISKVQEKGDEGKNGDDLKKLDGGEGKTQKSHKTTKFGKKVSFSEKSKALIQKKPNDLKRDNAMAEEIHETASPSRKSRPSKTKLFMGIANKTKKWGIFEDSAVDDTSKLPSSLKKLELECFPNNEPPSWLNPKDLNNLEKLSIKGGRLECFPNNKPPSWLNPKDLNNLEKLSIKGGKLGRISGEHQNAEDKWAVEILRLKYLHEFKVEWRDLQDLFPKMTLLEKYKCPKIAFCPTDGNGVWRKPSLEETTDITK